MEKLQLVRPAEAYKASYLAYQHENLAAGIKPNWSLEMMEAEFPDYVATMWARETDPLPGLVPQTDYWSLVGEDIVGRLSLRHYLNEELERHGGHIGYDIRPSFRRMGYGVEQCRLGILAARARGIGRILITCDDTNVGSAKIIEANGGVLWDKIDTGREVLTRRYWVEE